MSDFVHEPVPQVVVVQDPETGGTKAIEQVNSDMQHPTPDQYADMQQLKAKQAQERADLIMEQHEERHTDEDGNITLSEAFIKARDEGEGIIVIPPPPEKITTRPATEEEMENFVPYRATTPEQDKANVDDLVKKGVITEEKRDNWHAEIDKIAETYPAPDDGSQGQEVAVKDENVSPPPYSDVNGVDITEKDKVTVTQDPSSTPQTTERDTNEGTKTIDPEVVTDPRPTEIVVNKPVEGFNDENTPKTEGNKEVGDELKDTGVSDTDDKPPVNDPPADVPVLKLG